MLSENYFAVIEDSLEIVIDQNEQQILQDMNYLSIPDVIP